MPRARPRPAATATPPRGPPGGACVLGLGFSRAAGALPRPGPPRTCSRSAAARSAFIPNLTLSAPVAGRGPVPLSQHSL